MDSDFVHDDEDDDAIVKNKNTLAYPSSTLDPPISMIDQVKEIELAERTLKLGVNSKLDVIVKQIRALKNQAKDIIEKAHHDMELHKAECAFQKVIGEPIYLYKRGQGKLYFSRLSPEDWGGAPPHQFLGSYVMNYDKSFEKKS